MDDDVKTHPNLIPYEILPESEKKVKRTREQRKVLRGVAWRCVCGACVVHVCGSLAGSFFRFFSSLLQPPPLITLPQLPSVTS
jgi:hypothetical protein